MENILIADPVKLHVIDITTGKTVQSYVWVGDVVDAVKKELQSYQNGHKYNSNILKKYYGADFHKKLLIAKSGGGEPAEPKRTRIRKRRNAIYRRIEGASDCCVYSIGREVGTLTFEDSDNEVRGGAETDSNESQYDSDDVEGRDVDDADDIVSGINDDVDNVEGRDLNGMDDVEGSDLNGMNNAGDANDMGDGDAANVQTDTQTAYSGGNNLFDSGIDKNIYDEIGDIDDIINIKPILQIKDIEVNTKSLISANTSNTSYIFDTHLFQLDNILEFKYKIFSALNIPIYRQHLWWRFKGRSYPAAYTYSMFGHVENINIEDLIPANKSKQLEYVEGAPINMTYYKNKSFTKIVANDTFTTIGTIYEEYATNDYYLVDMNSIVDIGAIYEKLRNDKYQLDIIYYGFVAPYFPMITTSVFLELAKNEKNIQTTFPELMPARTALKHQLGLEKNILNSAYAADAAAIEKNLFSSITKTFISINNYNQDIELLLSLRNLFDVLELNEYMCYCKTYLSHHNKHLVLKKAYMSEPEVTEPIPFDSILIKFRLSLDTNENIKLIIFKNGNYIVRTNWREETHMDFKSITETVIKTINPVIAQINNMGNHIKLYNVNLRELTKKNVNFTETTIVFYFDSDVTDARFSVFKTILEDYMQANIIISKDSTALGYEYFFRKGMYKYESERIEKSLPLQNYYEFLSNGVVHQKWDTVFVKTHLLLIQNIASKIKVTIAGVRNDKEIENFHLMLINMFTLYEAAARKITVTSVDTKSKKTLKNLKLQDPLLYNFKKIYNSDVVYSKICQKPYQPVILSEEEYGRLGADRKENAIRYWNFTTQKPVWYSCPNAKFPYIKFIVKQHPRDFCIPCCKKLAVDETVNIERQKIHSSCMTKHVFTGEKVNITKGSQYIASYGKPIEIGRISRLPENTIEPLFFDTYSPGAIDQECSTTDGYYLFGLEQHLNALEYCGMLYCLVHSLNMTVDDFIYDCAQRVQKSTDIFRVLLDGKIYAYFSSPQQLADSIKSLTNELRHVDDVPWNKLLINIAYYYFGINVIVFQDVGKEMIELRLPHGLKNPDEMFPNSHKNLIVLNYKKRYYPVYLINTNIFKRTGIIDTRIFHNDSGLIAIIRAIVRKSFINIKKKMIDLVTLREFVAVAGYKIIEYYINYSNFCYAVLLSTPSTNVKMFVPVSDSHYTVLEEIKLNFTANYALAPIADIIKFVDKYNKWTNDNIAASHPKIAIEQWIALASTAQNMTVIGFIASGLNYYCEPFKIDVVRQTRGGNDGYEGPQDHAHSRGYPTYKGLPVQTVLYSPAKINSLIHSVKTNKLAIGFTHKRDLLQIGIYEQYMYPLVMLHLINIFNNQRNDNLRRRLVKICMRTNFDKDVRELKDFMDYVKSVDDQQKILKIISRYVTEHRNRELMVSQIAESYFDFDKIALERIKSLPHKEIIKELHLLCASFVEFGKPKLDKEFPNIFVECGDSVYCSKNKLVIEKHKLNEILNVIASDITNPHKITWMFNSAFVERTAKYFKFIRRANETIHVEFL